MSTSIKMVRTQRRGRIDAGKLVHALATAAVEHLSRSLILGVSPVDGTPRERKGDGNPAGYRTGRLAHGLHLGKLARSRARASVTIELPTGQETDQFRRAWVAKNPDVLTLEGNASRVIARATTQFMETDDGRTDAQ